MTAAEIVGVAVLALVVLALALAAGGSFGAAVAYRELAPQRQQERLHRQAIKIMHEIGQAHRQGTETITVEAVSSYRRQAVVEVPAAEVVPVPALAVVTERVASQDSDDVDPELAAVPEWLWERATMRCRR